MVTLEATKRDLSIKAKKLRREGFVPGNLFGKEIVDSLPLQFTSKEADRFIKKNREGTQVTLKADGETYNTIVKNIDYDPIKGQILTIDFQALVAGEKIQTSVPVVLINKDQATGYIHQELEELRYKAQPDHLLDTIEIDMAKYTECKSIFVKDLDVFNDGNIDIITSPDTIVVHVSDHLENIAVADDTATEDAATEETAAPAEAE